MRVRCGFATYEIPSALEFATAMLGEGTVFHVPADEVWGEGESTANGTILIRNDLEPMRSDFVVLHECAEIWIAWNRITFHHFLAKEAAADAIAAALLAPPEPFAEALLDVGENLEALAREFAAAQTAMALRIGEVTHAPVRVERPGRTRMRGAPFSRWETARRIAITDEPDRVALLGGN